MAGWEKAESEAAEFKEELESATKLRLETEDRARHLDGALKELMEQLRSGRKEHDKHLHDTIVKKTREFDKLRLEMEAKLAELTKSLSDNRTQLIESHAENEALNHALKVQPRLKIMRRVIAYPFLGIGALLCCKTFHLFAYL